LAEVLPAKQDLFRKEYGKRTGENPVDKQGFFVRKPGPTAWGVAYRIFFEPEEDWVNESLEKIGYHITSNNVFCPYEDIKFPFLISSEDFFWWLVDYGYRLGDNEAILFKQYEMRLLNGIEKKQDTGRVGDVSKTKTEG